MTEKDTFYYFEKGYKDVNERDLSPMFCKSIADTIVQRRKDEIEFVE